MFPQIKRKRTSIKAAVVAEIAKSSFGTVSNFPMDAKEKLGPLINTDCKGEHFFNLHVWYRVWQIFKYILILIQFCLCIHIYLYRHCIVFFIQIHSDINCIKFLYKYIRTFICVSVKTIQMFEYLYNIYLDTHLHFLIQI